MPLPEATPKSASETPAPSPSTPIWPWGEAWRWITAWTLFACAVIMFIFCGSYHDELGLRPGVDPLLASLPHIDVNWLLSDVWLGMHAAMAVYWFGWERRRIPYFIAVIALWIMVRNVFIAVMPVGQPEGLMRIYEDGAFSWIQGTLNFDSELFFSGHTGFPFLYFLLADRLPRARWALFFTSLVMGVGVLLTRNHYVIDVLGAFFVTYSAWKLGSVLFSRLDIPARI